jgi:tuberculosinol/isotuberculosinol synthase
MNVDLNTFLALPTEEAAHLVRAAGPQVCVIPINNTRRWFAMEYGGQRFDDPVAAYISIAGREHARVYKLLFDHGIDTIVTPVFGSELFRRGDEYMQKVGADGLARLATHPDFTAFYDENDIRVRFYGEHRKILGKTSYAYISDIFDQETERTLHHATHRLFWGTFATDATDAIAEFVVRYYTEHGKVPSRREIVEMYYGEYVDYASMFISSDKFWVFDYPMLSSGEEDLYYMVAPVLYLSERQLRHILFDHLVARSIDHPDYEEMSAESFLAMKEFYTSHREDTLGVGKLVDRVWYPL